MNNALPPYVFLPTGLFLAKLIAHKEGEDRSRWVTDFAVQLVEGAGRDDFARRLIDTAVIKQNAAMNRVRRSRAKSELISEGVKNPTRQQIEERLKEIYAEEELTASVKDISTQVTPTSNAGDESPDARKCAAVKSAMACNPLTADGDIREDSQAKPDGSAITRNETRAHDALEPSANHYGDAPRREAEDESATVSNISQDAPHGNAGEDERSGRTITRNGSRVSENLDRPAPNMRRVPQNEAPAHGFSGGRTAQGTMSRSPEAAAQSGKDYDKEPDQVSTEEALESQHGAGEVAPENVSKKPSPALPILSFGEFGNIKMTNMQYAKLCERFGNADSVLAEADQYFEAQPAKKKKYKNHYAMLLNWCKRRETESKPKQGYMTSDDISKKNYEESKARLEAMFSKGRKTA